MWLVMMEERLGELVISWLEETRTHLQADKIGRTRIRNAGRGRS